jgi:hypothetical protein
VKRIHDAAAGTVTRIDGHTSDVRLKGTAGIEFICQLVSVFAAVPRCAEAHACAFVKLFMKVCARLIEPIDYSQVTRQVKGENTFVNIAHFVCCMSHVTCRMSHVTYYVQVDELLETIGRNNASKLMVSCVMALLIVMVMVMDVVMLMVIGGVAFADISFYSGCFHECHGTMEQTCQHES